MICRRCKDLHAGDNLARSDGGISLALGDCTATGTAHEWRQVNFIADAPYIVSEGKYKAKRVTVAQLRLSLARRG